MISTFNFQFLTRRLALFAVLLMMSYNGFAGPVGSEKARSVAQGFWTENPQCGEVKALADVSDRLAIEGLYAFEINGGEGFVIVAGDDCVRPVLGYGFGRVPTGQLRPNVHSWLHWYGSQIAALKNSERQAPEAVAAEWQRLLSVTAKSPGRKSVSQLLTTKWDQDPLYNRLCPYDSTHRVYTYTGCSATATAQVMKYWNHPRYGQGSHSYTENDYGVLSANFGETRYDWDNMPDSLTYSSTAAQINAVATLMYHIGVAIEMDYGVDGSGAYTISYDGYTPACSEVALPTYFDYKPTLRGLDRSYYDDSEWIATMKNELDHSRPVAYTGSDEEMAHAFVLDGYDDQLYFHVNWGWSGWFDGWYLLDSLVLEWGGAGSNETYTYNLYQTALIGIEPNDDVLRVSPAEFYRVACNGKTLSTTLRTNSRVTTGWTAVSDADWLTVSPSAGEGSGAIATLALTVAANTADERTAHITVTQGDETVTITVSQREALEQQQGWVGNSEAVWDYTVEASGMAIICPERFGTYNPGDRVTKVRFVTYRGNGGNSNNDFSIRIYHNPMPADEIADINLSLYTWNTDQYIGQLVYEQPYTQTQPGVQEVTLNTPYVIDDAPFWIAVYCAGQSSLMYNFTNECPDPVAYDNYPNVECALSNYRYLRTGVYSDEWVDYEYMEVAYDAECIDYNCDTLVQVNMDYALDFFVEADPTPTEGIDDIVGSNSGRGTVSVYPNPANSTVTVSGENIRKVELIDLSGRQVSAWNHGGTLALPQTAAGVYCLRVSTMQTTETIRLIIK